MHKIFLVEDDGALARLIIEHLEKYGYEVLRCTDYEHITPVFLSSKAHLALLDVNLPRYDGYHVCREIPKVSQIPILFISARDSSMDTIMALSVGGDDYLAKPFSFELLTAKIEAMLRRPYSFTETTRETLEYAPMPRYRSAGGTFPIGSSNLRLLNRVIHL